MGVRGKRWSLTAPWKLSALFWNCIHKFWIWSWCGYFADNCSIKKVRIILVPFRFYNQIGLMRILSALLNLWMGYYMMHKSNETYPYSLLLSGYFLFLFAETELIVLGSWAMGPELRWSPPSPWMIPRVSSASPAEVATHWPSLVSVRVFSLKSRGGGVTRHMTYFAPM